MTALFGLLYGVGLAAWGVLVSGGGHFNLPVMLAVSPAWAGILLWLIGRRPLAERGLTVGRR